MECPAKIGRFTMRQRVGDMYSTRARYETVEGGASPGPELAEQ